MGGMGFLLAIVVLGLVLTDFDIHPQYLLLIALIALFGLIGLADDLLKIFNKRNLGLTFWQKILSQTAVAALFAFFLVAWGWNYQVSGWLAWLGFQNPFLYLLLVIFMVVGGANAANLTDGLNGLLAGCATIAFLTLALLAGRSGLGDGATFALIAAGAIYAFLYFNFPHARVFMGDVGSLAIGGALAGLAIVIHRELRLVLVGGVLVIEALSVILQVGGYKLYRKRLFKMAPLHHHFELLGISEINVVLGFWVAAILFGLAALLI